MTSTKFNELFKLAVAVDIAPGKKLVYDSRANLLMTMSDNQLNELVKFVTKKSEPTTPDETMFANLQRSGILVPGSWPSLFDSSIENIDKVLKHNSDNILMRKYVLEVTQDCNFRCSYCSNTIETEFRHHKHRNMPIEVAQQAIDYYFKIYTTILEKGPKEYRDAFLKSYSPSLGYYGGEPTINFKVVREATEYMLGLPWEHYGIKPSEITFTCNTNLSYMTNSMIDFLVGHDFLLFASLDGPASEHDKNRVDLHGKPTFDRAFRNLGKIRERAPEFFKNRVNVLAVEAPNHNSALAHEFLDSLGCKISYMPMSTYGTFVANPETKLKNLLTHRKEIIEDAIKAFDERPEDELKNYLQFEKHNISGQAPVKVANLLPTCPAATDNMMVDVDGNFHVCHKTDGSFILGNVKSGLDCDALRRYYSELAKTADNERCRACWAIRSCGQCAAVRLHGGKFTNPTEEECAYIRESALVNYEIFAKLYDLHPDLLDRIQEYVNNPESYSGVFDLSTVKWENFRQR